jgi:gliding motility-associated protein GldM
VLLFFGCAFKEKRKITIMPENNLSPRQKMIGMMYLVLTAMLALNVQREILDAFVVIEDGTASSLRSLEKRNGSLYSEFKFAHGLDPLKTGSYWEGANSVQQESDHLVSRIDSLKSQIIAATEGIEPSVADTISLLNLDKIDQYNDATRILAGEKEDASTGEAHQLRVKIESFAQYVNGTMGTLHLDSLSMPFDFSERLVEDKMVNWEMRTFYEIPMAACIAILTKLQNDVRTIEYNAVSQMLSAVDVDDIPVDTVIARVVPRSQYIILGETYQSDIFLSAYNSTTQPEIEFDGPGDMVIEDGMGKLSFRPATHGSFDYKGQIVIHDKKGNPRKFPFESSYMVVKPSASVSPTKMNVLYVGPKNPLSISVPGIPEDKVSVSISGGNQIRKTGAGLYEADMVLSSPANVEVIVKAEMDGGVKEMARMTFRVKKLPTPYVRFGSVKNSGRMDAFDLINSSLIAEYDPDFVFQLPLTVVEFKLIVNRGDDNVDRLISGRKLRQQDEELMRSLKPGTVVYLEDMRVKDASGRVLPANNIKITVKN